MRDRCAASSDTWAGGRAGTFSSPGLEKLEYRGYDSAGVSLLDDGHIETVRAVGNLANLRDAVEEAAANGGGTSR